MIDRRNQKRKELWITTLAVGAVLIGLIVGFLLWASFSYGPADTAVAAMASDAQVRFRVHDHGWLVFEPVSGQVRNALVWFPEARVDVRSYAFLAKSLAARGHMVVLVPVPFNLANFAPDAARQVTRSFPNIGFWALGGHGLGGTVASEAVFDSGVFAGLVLCAAVPGNRVDLSGKSRLMVFSLYGSNDGIVPKVTVLGAVAKLPSGTRLIEINGGNHAQFAQYGVQEGDGSAGIDSVEQMATVVEYVGEFMDSLGF